MSNGLSFSSLFPMPISNHSDDDEKHHICAIGLRCLNGRCQPNNFGLACLDSRPICFDASFSASFPNALCLHGLCTPTKLPGDLCREDQECLGASKCSTDGVCVGLALDSPCRWDEECRFGLFCDTRPGAPQQKEDIEQPASSNITAGGKVCQPLGQNEHPCQSDRECALGLTCQRVSVDQLSRQCLPIFSRQLGDAAEVSDLLHFPCAPGLFRALDDTCSIYTSFDLECEDHASRERDEDKSDDDADCSLLPGSSCQCNLLVDEEQCSSYYTPSNETAAALLSLQTCLSSAECPAYLRWRSWSCEYQHCNSYYTAARIRASTDLNPMLGECALVPFYAHLDADDDDEIHIDKGLMWVLIIGISFCCVVFIILIALGIYHCRSQKDQAIQYEVVSVN